MFPVRWLVLLPILVLTSCQEKDPWAGRADIPVTISFNQHIRPLLSRECLSCHNAEKAEGGLQLDRASGVAAVTTDNSPRRSRLWEMIAASHPVALPERDQAILWRWIKQGTPTEGHWASLPLSTPPVASLGSRLSPQEPVSEQEFAFLARTLFGREPIPAEIEYNTKHQPPRGDLIDGMLRQKGFAESFKTRLLLLSGASPVPANGPFAPYLRWLDNEVANPSLALDDFFRESLAGDLVPESGQQGAIATAWTRLPNRSGITSLSDRVGETLLGITPSNAASANALWPNAGEILPLFLPEPPPATKGNQAYPPFLPLHTPQQLEALKQARAAETEAWTLANEIPEAATVAFAEWLAEEQSAVDVPDLAVAFAFDTATPKDRAPRPVGSLVSPLTVAEGVHGTALAPPANFEGLPLASDRAFTLSFFLKLSHLPDKEEPLFFAKTPQGAAVGFRLNLSPEGLTVALLNGSAANSLAARAVTLPQPGHWHHLAIGYDGSRRAEGFKLWIDAQPIQLSTLHNDLYGIASSPGGRLSFQFPVTENTPPTLIDELQIHRRLLTDIEAAHVRDGKALLEAVRDQFPREDLLFDYYLNSRSPLSRQNRARAVAASNEVSTLQATALLVPIAKSNPLPEVRPALPFFSLPLDAEPDRLGLANWLLNDRNPVTPRVVASRLYQLVHGVSLLPAEDISDPWQVPTDPALLDYLARDLLIKEWNLRGVLRTILLNPPLQDEPALPWSAEA